MSKRGVINPVYGMTDAAFFDKIRSMLRKQWRHSQPYRDAIKRAKKPYVGAGRRKFSIACEQCGKEYAMKERIEVESAKKGIMKDVLAYQIDHKIDAGSLKSFADLSGFAARLFCTPDELQILCYHCHSKKTYKKKGGLKDG